MPFVGQFRSNQIGVGTGSLIILVITLVFARWIGAPDRLGCWGSKFSGRPC
jgi:hypothetical protein